MRPDKQTAIYEDLSKTSVKLDKHATEKMSASLFCKSQA